MNIIKEVLEIEDKIKETRRYLHQHPEISLKEYETAAYIESELDALDIPHKRIGETGVYGVIKGKKPGKTIALRCDIDALSIEEKNEHDYVSLNKGVMHACGHDEHVTSCLMAATILKQKEFDGEVRLFFQQAEELGKGAKIFIKEGCLEGVDEIIGYHTAPTLKVGTVCAMSGANNASCDYFKIEITGKSAHVSQPHRGIDALYIASQIVVNIQSIVSRYTDPIDTVVVGIGKLQAGTAYNIVANNAIIEGTTRAFSYETREKINSMVETLAKDIAKMYGAECDVYFEDLCGPLINDETVSDKCAKVASDIADEVVTYLERRLWADDFGEYLRLVPGCYMNIGTANEDWHTQLPLHHECNDFDERSMSIAISIYVNYVLQYLCK